MKKEVKKNIKDLIEPLFASGHFLYTHSNFHGEYWIAYINMTTYDIHLTGCDVDFEWKIVKTKEGITAPFIMEQDELTWLRMVGLMAQEFRSRYEQLSKNNQKRDRL
jgi:hypothetical protein